MEGNNGLLKTKVVDMRGKDVILLVVTLGVLRSVDRVIGQMIAEPLRGISQKLEEKNKAKDASSHTARGRNGGYA